MFTISCLILLLGFLGLYSTSQRAVFVVSDNLLAALKKNVMTTKLISGVLLLVALILFTVAFGLGSGILLYVIALMTLGGMVIILQPLGLFKTVPLVIFLVCCVIIEYIV